jgi:DegV family protein with EDD domain
MAMGVQVLAAARAAEAGKALTEVIAAAEQARDRTGVLFVVDTLEFLHRGGRIGGAQRLLGTVLNMKPLLEVREGKVEPIERVRTARKALARLLDLIEERTGGRKPLRLATIHAAAEDQARELLAAAQERFNPDEALLSEASPVVGTHAGPGTLGLAYCAGV